MAKVRGRDVLLELMETAAKLEATATAHAEKLESLAVHAAQAAAEVAALRVDLRDVARAVRGVEQGLKERVDALERKAG